MNSQTKSLGQLLDDAIVALEAAKAPVADFAQALVDKAVESSEYLKMRAEKV